MNEGHVLTWLVAGLLGLLLGAGFYSGLWWTIWRALRSPRPGLWFTASLALRTLFALAGFYVVGGAEWQRMALCLLGFLVARPLVTRLTARMTRPAAKVTAIDVTVTTAAPV